MRMPVALSVLASGVLLASGLATTMAGSAQAAPAAPPAEAADTASGAVTPMAWYSTVSRGGKIRACYKEACEWYYNTAPGDSLLWSHYAYNEFGNRWYYVDNGFTRGWIYCGNVTAGC